MKTISYKITFHTYWHCGSGLSAGADVDALVIKDKSGMPFVPGKTVKGLVREAVDALSGDRINTPDYLAVFGSEGDMRGESFFSNAVLGRDEYDYIVGEKAEEYMYDSIASTAIDNDGIAVDNSLRKIQVTVPCVLEGKIHNVPEGMAEPLCKALAYVKRMGQWRNRGLGRCDITAGYQPDSDAKKGDRL